MSLEKSFLCVDLNLLHTYIKKFSIRLSHPFEICGTPVPNTSSKGRTNCRTKVEAEACSS